jgi:hypothetical protein
MTLSGPKFDSISLDRTSGLPPEVTLKDKWEAKIQPQGQENTTPTS